MLITELQNNKAELTELWGGMDRSALMVGDFDIYFFIIGKYCQLKVTEQLNNTWQT